MVRHCTRCRRKWVVSVLDKQKYYICPDCAEKEKAWMERKGREDAKRLGEMIADVRKVSGREGFYNGKKQNKAKRKQKERAGTQP